MNDDKKTERLLTYVNDPQNKDITNITEDEQHVYFETDNIKHGLVLRSMGYETWYQENPKDYNFKVRVLKPNWFSKPLREEMKGL